jgi:hypothetical protein
MIAKAKIHIYRMADAKAAAFLSLLQLVKKQMLPAS